MNFILNLIVVIITIGFAGAYVLNLIINLRRALKVNKVIKSNSKDNCESSTYVQGNVVEVDKQKSRVYVHVEYTSPANGSRFINVFELTHKEFNDQYYVGQEVKIYYADTKELEKVNCFPVYLEGQKIGLEMGPLVTDIILVAGGLYVFITILLQLLQADETGLIGLQWNGRPFIESTRNLDTTVEGTVACFSGVYIFVIAIFYVMLFTYLKERITGMSITHKNNYLKICGLQSRAEVKTFKFAKQKNANGTKESVMEIEFFTRKGEKVNCELRSYLYTESQEQFINILYDEKSPSNVVYLNA